MNRNEKKQFSPPTVNGASLLLVVFAVLCLTIFALLSLSTVRANMRLGDASAVSVTSYYEADCEAQEILARLRAGEIPEGVMVYNGVYYYKCSISDTQALNVAVQVNTPQDYTILYWQALPVDEWKASDNLELWNGTLS